MSCIIYLPRTGTLHNYSSQVLATKKEKDTLGRVYFTFNGQNSKQN